jgi:hypothetical protein
MRRRTLRLPLAFAGTLVLLFSTTKADARDIPSGMRLNPDRLAHILGTDQAPSAPEQTATDIHSPNMKLVGRSAKTGTINSDLAFQDHVVYAGNYDGFRIIDARDPRNPVVLSDTPCHGAQDDISIWGNLMFLSVDHPETKRTCDSEEVPIDPSDPSTWVGYEGIRIFDVTDKADPQLLKFVETDCGSHTHTLVPDPANERLLLYVSSYALLPGPHCGPDHAQSDLHRKISIVEVPLADPEAARVIATPRIDAPVLNIPGYFPTIGCHDIQVLLPLHLAAAACLTEGQLWDISDPANPKTLEATHIRNDAFTFWHSAAFTWDGQVVAFSDETFFQGCETPGDQDGRVWFYSVADPSSPLGSFGIPRPQGGQYCSMHLFDIIPVTDRYLLVGSAYGGGTTVVDFTDPSAPTELGFYDAQDPIAADTWSSYFWNGAIYANDIPRGVDIFRLNDSASRDAMRFRRLNPQTQTVLLG